MALTRFKGATLAPWWKRAFCLIMDWATFWPLAISIYLIMFLGALFLQIMNSGSNNSPIVALLTGPSALALSLFPLVADLAFGIWNYWVLRGSTGRTLASRMWYLRVVDVNSGLPIGGWRAFARSCLHILDLFLMIGFIWPLFDKQRRQTFADMIMGTVVVIDDRNVPPHVTSWRRPRPQGAPEGPPQQPQTQQWMQPYAQPQPQFTARPRPVDDDDPLDTFMR